jgi:hypothetical protein
LTPDELWPDGSPQVGVLSGSGDVDRDQASDMVRFAWPVEDDVAQRTESPGGAVLLQARTGTDCLMSTAPFWCCVNSSRWAIGTLPRPCAD